MVAKSGAAFQTMSNFTDVGIADVKTAACSALLAKRLETKMRSKKVGRPAAAADAAAARL